MRILQAWLINRLATQNSFVAGSSEYLDTELAEDRSARRADEAHSADIVHHVGDPEVENFDALFV